jgi:hypothetical protein
MYSRNSKLLWIVVLVLIIAGSSIYFSRTPEDKILEDSTLGGKMTFFVTSENKGDGADFGGILGADRYCQSLAEKAGADEMVWVAYLSSVSDNVDDNINAKDRIGNGPWYNFKGELIAINLEGLHLASNNINKQTALNEYGKLINGRGDSPNVHDILTGSMSDGTASTTDSDTTCSNWTSSSDGSAIVGHHDRMGLDESDAAKSWNSSHGSRGCSLQNLNSTGGGGLLYCFAKN